MFLAGNDLPARLRPGFQVAELGFGTGLNLLALLIANPTTPVRFTSFEAFPLPAADIARALDHFPEARAVAEPFLQAWARGKPGSPLARLRLRSSSAMRVKRLPLGRAAPMRGFWTGFSPAKNPELVARNSGAGRPSHRPRRHIYHLYRRGPCAPRACRGRVHRQPPARPRQETPYERRSSAMTANRKGILLMIAAVASFAVQDGFSRHLAGTYNTLMVVMVRYWCFAGFVTVLALRRPEGFRAAIRSRRLPAHVVRSLLLVARSA